MDQDDFDIFLQDPELNAYLDNNEFAYVQKAPGAKEVFGDILKTLGLLDPFIDLFKENLFLHTYPLNKREIIDLPIGLLDKDYAYDDWIVGTQLFWNKTDRSYFSRKCDAISAYLALGSESFLGKLDTIAKKLPELGFDFDPVDILLLFKNGTVQERRVGFLLYGMRRWRKWRIRWEVPFYYLERNYWFTDEEQKIIENELGAIDEKEQEILQERHLISDRVGFGDFRFCVDYPITTKPKFNSRLGGFITIPSAWALNKGLEGSNLCIADPRPTIDFTDIIERGIEQSKQEELFQELKTFAFKALDHLGAMLLNSTLGNGRHLGIGLFAQSVTALSIFIKQNWAQNINWKSFVSLEYLVPKTERRFFIERIDERLFDMRNFCREACDEAQADKDMAFLNEQFIDRLFPLPINVKVRPGIVFRWTGKLAYEKDRWGFHLGTDTWIKSGESFSSLCVEDNIVDRLCVKKARRILGYQYKIIGSLFGKIHRSNRDWILSLNGDTTIAHSGIGSDYNVSLDLEVDF